MDSYIARLTAEPDQPHFTIAVNYSSCNETQLVSVNSFNSCRRNTC